MKRFIVLLPLLPFVLTACPGDPAPTASNTVGVSSNGIPVESFCDPKHPTRVYYMNYSDGGGSHIAISVIADPSCAK